MILLAIVIFVHELGHFWAALACGFKVEAFSIGFGPRLFGIRIRDTDFRLSAVPVGGYVRIVDHQSRDENATDPRSCQSKPRWQRAVVIAAGPLANLVLAVGIVAGLYMYAFPEQVKTTDPVITSIKAGSPAARAGLQAGDRIVQLNGKQDPDWDFIVMQEALNADHAMHGIFERHSQRARFTITPRTDSGQGIGFAGWGGEQNLRVEGIEEGSPAARAGLRTRDLLIAANGQRLASAVKVQQVVFHSGGHPLKFQVMRNGHLEDVTITPVATNDPTAPWRIGIRFAIPVQTVKLRLGPALSQSLRLNQHTSLMIFQGFGRIVAGRVSVKSLSGPIGIAQMSREAAQAGAWDYLFLMALLSLQLGLFNLFPIPILDGGALLILSIEMLLQREMKLQVKEIISRLGCAFLIMIVVLVMYNDLSRLLTRS